MHIIHIIEATATGTLSMVELLANQQVVEHEVTVIYSVRPDTPVGFSEIFDERVNLQFINMSGLYAVSALVHLRKLLRSMPDAVVHCHSSVAGFLSRCALWRLPNRCFYSPHCIAFMRTDISALQRSVFVFLERFAMLFAKQYIACSHSEADMIRQYLPHARVDVVENAVDFSIFPEPVSPEQGVSFHSNEKTSVTDNDNALLPDIHVITVGGIRAQKDPHTFAQIATACPYEHVKFTWVGDGDEAAKQVLLEAGVTITGWCTRAEVVNQLTHADIYLSTALWEGLPVALIEAQSVGAILIVNACSGNTDIVKNLETGYVFSTVSQAHEILYNVVTDLALAKFTAAKGPYIARQRFGINRYCTAIQALYQQNKR